MNNKIKGISASRNLLFRRIVNFMQKIARLCSKERTMSSFVRARPPVFLPLTHPHLSSRAKRLGAIFHQWTMPRTGLVLLTKLRWVSLLLRGESSGGVPHHGKRRPLSP
jgi:hypothetical protein